MWGWILLASVLAFGLKFIGYMTPEKIVENPRVIRTAGFVTIGLLGSLIAMNAVGDGQGLSFDARLGALAIAIIAFYFRAPFLLVVILGAAATAALRAIGL